MLHERLLEKITALPYGVNSTQFSSVLYATAIAQFHGDHIALVDVLRHIAHV